VNGDVLATFTDVSGPCYLSTESEGHVFVTDGENDCILLLNSELHLERVLLDKKSQVALCEPTRLCYNELASQLCIQHSNYNADEVTSPSVISQFHLR